MYTFIISYLLCVLIMFTLVVFELLTKFGAVSVKQIKRNQKDIILYRHYFVFTIFNFIHYLIWQGSPIRDQYPKCAFGTYYEFVRF